MPSWSDIRHLGHRVVTVDAVLSGALVGVKVWVVVASMGGPFVGIEVSTVGLVVLVIHGNGSAYVYSYKQGVF